MSASGRLSRRARAFVAVSPAFLVAWQAALLAGEPRRVGVALGLYGFVMHMLFGKAYSLVPSYFDRELSVPAAPLVHLPLSVLGATALAAGAAGYGPDWIDAAGAAAWALGAVVFVLAVLWTVRDNLSGAETGTSDANEDRRAVDRAANAFVPVGLAYLLVGSYETVATYGPLVPIFDGYPPRATHLIAAGTAAVVLFAVGFRLLPRFTVTRPPRPLVAVVLPAGALGPAMLAQSILGGDWLLVGALLETAAVVGFAVVVGTILYRTDRDRVGFNGVLAGALAGVAAVAIGAHFAVSGIDYALVGLHYRLNLLGFLGLTIVGVAYQFYPPTVGRFPGANDRTALASILLIAAGLVAESVGVFADRPGVLDAGHALALLGSLLYAGLIWGIFQDRYRGR